MRHLTTIIILLCCLANAFTYYGFSAETEGRSWALKAQAVLDHKEQLKLTEKQEYEVLEAYFREYFINGMSEVSIDIWQYERNKERLGELKHSRQGAWIDLIDTTFKEKQKLQDMYDKIWKDINGFLYTDYYKSLSREEQKALVKKYLDTYRSMLRRDTIEKYYDILYK